MKIVAPISTQLNSENITGKRYRFLEKHESSTSEVESAAECNNISR